MESHGSINGKVWKTTRGFSNNGELTDCLMQGENGFFLSGQGVLQKTERGHDGVAEQEICGFS